MSYLCSEYLEFHQTELDKLTAQLKDMKRNSRLVGTSLVMRMLTQSRGCGVPLLTYWRGEGAGTLKKTDSRSKAIASWCVF
jgi:hypothetical protein